MAQHRIHKVAAGMCKIIPEPLLNGDLSMLQLPLPRLHNILWEQQPHHFEKNGECVLQSQERARLDILEHSGHPVVVLGAYKTVVGFSKCKVSDKVERHQVVPFDHVSWQIRLRNPFLTALSTYRRN